MKTIKYLGLTVLAALAVTLLFQIPITRADNRGQRGDDNERGGWDHRAVKVTFTKYVVDYPSCGVLANMAGVVGGDVGVGPYTGELLFQSAEGDVWKGEALYHFHGQKHSLTALVHVEQTGATTGSKAVITGVVTDGWLKGHAVKGEYTQIDCGQPGPDFPFCYEGTLEIERD